MNVVGYVRLSRDEDKENYSSIVAQKEIIIEYAKKLNWEICRMYVDDNYSGYTFDRPAFNRMKEDIENGKVDVIIAKDISRIGRHNAKTLLFIEYVQTNGKRLVLPEEGSGYDTESDDDDILGIKTWYNERYVKDISKKIKANMHIKQRKGELVMGNLYGYIKDPNNKSKLYIDENIRPIIQLIFKLYIDGLGYKKISDILNEKSYPTPSAYIKQKHAESGRVFKNLVSDLWQTHNIQRIVQNDLYIGTLWTHKKQNKKIGGKQEKVKKEEQYCFENHHEAIISKEDFELAQQINNKRRSLIDYSGKSFSNVKATYKGNAKYDYIFSSFVFCGDCGFAATGKNLGRKPKVIRGYECTQYAKYGLQRCVSHNVWEDKLLFFFKEFLKEIKNQYEEYLKTFNFEQSRKNVTESLNRLQKELKVTNEELKILLNQKIKDIIKETNAEFREIIEDSYSQLENDKKARINELTIKIEELKRVGNKDIEKKIQTAIDKFDSIIESERPDRKVIEMILDRILIYHDKTIEFKLLVDISELTYDNTSMI
ncbi:recombinase family protein [Pseudobacteroides cellulosolvens]|uniref:Resolvase domain-containing protein n=1 Tax=Pseudobacteroides cellulosolvens ATCC 35603 = DSM 2933 TaxID=398512 RepID=A0A0L6JM99_9FIRM|nr:recombinase family protein [Pseudobacteroides cellulosolvens]KNY26880.1 Resolvase domain-containing protein [Pseudobacteroides cellulosolvens ATCC 35603 = DSM 2933]